MLNKHEISKHRFYLQLIEIRFTGMRVGGEVEIVSKLKSRITKLRIFIQSCPYYLTVQQDLYFF